jgi:hypothetical protein
VLGEEREGEPCKQRRCEQRQHLPEGTTKQLGASMEPMEILASIGDQQTDPYLTPREGNKRDSRQPPAILDYAAGAATAATPINKSTFNTPAVASFWSALEAPNSL